MDKEIEKKEVPLEARDLLANLKHLEYRNDKWRFKGRRANIVDTVVGMRERGDSPQDIAEDLQLSVDAILEAMTFLEKYPELIQKHYDRMKQIADEHSHR